MGRGGKRGGREGGGGGFEDQYGEGMMSQDRGDKGCFSGRGGGSFTGGGEAGGGRKDSNISVVRSVPKFLQGHMHLLGRKHPDEEEEAQLATVDEQEEQARGTDDADDQEALEKAVTENPGLAEQYPELKPVADRARASQAKEAGNRAFAAKNFEEAARCFSEAIALHQVPIYFSNRAAAYHALKQYRKAAEDARQVIRLDQRWVKGWSRLAAAHFALEEWSEAKDAYSEAARLEPNDLGLQSMRHKAEVEEAKQEADRVVKFKQSRQQGRPAAKRANSDAPAGIRKKTLLSFDMEDI